MSPLHSFAGVSAIRVVNEASPLVGQRGRFVREVRLGAGRAWVHMDDELPLELRSTFPDADRRAHNVVLFPDECEAIPQ